MNINATRAKRESAGSLSYRVSFCSDRFTDDRNLIIE
jgi:hypothetical protein